MKKAKAAVFIKANEPFEIREYEVVKAPKGLAGIELIASGVCGTDIHIQTGKLGCGEAIIGHEMIGKIDDIDPIEGKMYGLKVGDNVVVDIAVPCGTCLLCKSGDDANCVNMKCTNEENPSVAPHLFGGYAEYNYTQIQNLIKIPDELDPKAVSVFACPGPTAMHAFRMGRECGMDLSKVNVAVVQGAGPVGCYAIMYLKAMGVKEVIAVTSGKNPKRDELAKSLGATEVLGFATTPMQEIVSYLQSKNGGLGVDLVYEASGNPDAVLTGMEILRNRGIYLIPGQYSNSGNVSIPPQMITFKAIRLVGSSQYSFSDVRDYLSFLNDHKDLQAKINDLATCYKVEDVNKAFDDAKAGTNIKTVLVK